MRIVAKFGGTSLANSNQIKKIANIVKDNGDIVALVVSAPGKRHPLDTKVTDLLIRLFNQYTHSSNKYEETIDEIIGRYREICQGLDLEDDILLTFREKIISILSTITDSFYLENAIKSLGEDFNAQLIAAYLNKIGLKARYISPLDAGIKINYVLNEPVIDKSTYENIARLREINDLMVIPGFYGYNNQGQILTFLRGGSDITGSIIARGLGADEYHNYTDMSFIYAANPNLIANPKPIKNITFSEMRELSYNGFQIFQEDAVEPLLDTDIQIRIKNTNAPSDLGTIISTNRDDVSSNPVIGISNVGNFISFNIKEYMMNRKVGYIKKLLDIFEYQHIAVEHIPTGIDSLSILVREENIENESQLQSLKNAIDANFNYHTFKVRSNLASIAIVGEGLTGDMTKALYLISKSLNEENIKVEFIIQGATNNSLFLFIDKKDEKVATEKLYSYFI